MSKENGPHRLRRMFFAVTVPGIFRRFLRAIKYARKEEYFAAVFGAAIFLIFFGTVVFSLGEGWNVVDGFYFSVATLTTTSVSDPNLTLTHDSLKLFSSFYVLIGIGILVELVRELGVGYVKEREERHTRHHKDTHHKEDPPETKSHG